MKANDIKYELSQIEANKSQIAEQQKQMWRMVEELFPEDIQEIIRAKFDRVKGLSDSEMIMDSNTSDHHINLMMMMADEQQSMLLGGVGYQSVLDQ